MSEQAINYVDVPHQLKSGDSVFPRVVLNDGSLQTLDECASWIEQIKPHLKLN